MHCLNLLVRINAGINERSQDQIQFDGVKSDTRFRHAIYFDVILEKGGQFKRLFQGNVAGIVAQDFLAIDAT